MAGLEHAARGRILEEYVEVDAGSVDRRAVRVAGPRTSCVTPKPATEPHPMLFVGGGVPAAARRAARLRLPMFPMNTDQSVRDAYFDEAKKIGYRGLPHRAGRPDVRARGRRPRPGVGARSASTCCTRPRPTRRTRRPGSTRRPGVHAESVDDLKASPQYVVGTPDRCSSGWQDVPAEGGITLSPLAGGLPPDLAWASLELFAAQVLPQLRSPARASDSA